jgi:MATE family multidrug resistance protein
MACSAVAFLLAPAWIASAYTNDPATIALACTLIPIAGVFQVFDGLQVVSAGLLRGVGDTRAPMLINVFAFWLVGIPVSLLLGFRAGGGVVGLWWGFVAGLAAVALLLMLRVRARLRRTLERLRVHADADEVRA